VKAWRSGLWKDTLTKRLFLLIWATLLLSHVLGFWFAHLGGPASWQTSLSAVPLTPGMPPLPGNLPDLPGSQAHGDEQGPGFGFGPHGERGPGHEHEHAHEHHDAQRGGEHGHPPFGPWDGDHAEARAAGVFRAGAPFAGRPNLWLDYFVRIVVTGVAAWLGARWLTAPMRRLALASESLSQALSRREPLPQLDEQGGTLEVRQTAQVFNNMARQLQDQFDERSLLMAAVSHDLRTPLTRLRIRLERLLPDPTAERCVQDVQDVNAMIEAVLDALNEERSQEQALAIDVLALVQALADDLSEEGQAVSAQGDAATVRVQPVAFKRVLDNLVHNALRYGQRADIGVRRAAGQVHITIDDAGPGIPAELMASVFKPFVRLDTSRSRDTGGVGLGLYIARELTLRNGGALTLQNRPEGGLRAELVLPESV